MSTHEGFFFFVEAALAHGNKTVKDIVLKQSVFFPAPADVAASVFSFSTTMTTFFL